MSNTAKTLRLNMPQWQGGNDPGYHFGSQLLSFLAPAATGPVETVPVPPPVPGVSLSVENGIVARHDLIRQAKAARQAIERHAPARIVTLGGDCLVSLAPFAYLNGQHAGKLGVLWVDSHPDVMTPAQYAHAHAHVLGSLLGRGDAEFAGLVDQPLRPDLVMYAGLDAWQTVEAEIIDGLGLAHTSSAELAETSAPILNWITAKGITHLAVHFDLDVLDPKLFRPLLFNKPTLGPDDFAGVPRGKMTTTQVVRLLRDVAGVCDVVGLTIAEHMPWDTLAMRDMLASLPLMVD